MSAVQRHVTHDDGLDAVDGMDAEHQGTHNEDQYRLLHAGRGFLDYCLSKIPTGAYK